MADEVRKRTPRERLTREESRALTRSRLLESAHALFALKGFEGTSVDDIAADAGYTRGAFYSNFANKDEIMKALIGTGFDSDLAAVAQMGGGADIEHVARLYRELARQFSASTENALWMLEFQLAAVRHPELRASYLEQFGRLREGVAELVEESMRGAGHPEPAATRRFADVFIVILSGLSVLRLLDPAAVDEALFEDAFRAMTRGLSRDDAAGYTEGEEERRPS